MEAEIQKTTTEDGEPSNRQEWLKWRQGFIGSSDASALHGASPHTTALEVFDDKTAEEIEEEEENFAMARGNQFEPIARRLFAAEYNIENLTDESFLARRVVSADVPYLSASLDGCTEDGVTALSEFKYQGAEAHKRTADETLPVRGGRVPEYYWIQMQHQLLVTGAKVNWFGSYNPKAETQFVKVPVYPDEAFMVEHLKVCENFWLNHVIPKVPPPASEKDFVTMRVKGAKAKAKRLIYLKEKIKDLTAEKDEVQEWIEARITHPKMRCDGLRIIQVTKIGNVDYKKIPAVAAMSKAELDALRGKSSTFYKMDVDDAADGK